MEGCYDKIHLELDPMLETLGLLFQVKSFEQNKKLILKELEELGLDGLKFYEKHMQTYEIYVTEFEKNYVTKSEYDFLLELGDSQIMLLLISLLVEHRELLSEIEHIEEEVIIQEVLEFCKELFQFSGDLPKDHSLDSIIDFLEIVKINEQDKWYLMRFIQKPKKILTALTHMVNQNKGAFEQAKKVVETELQALLNQYKEEIYEQKKVPVGNLQEGVSDTIIIYPSLVFPLSYLQLGTSGYYGLLLQLIISSKNMDFTKEELLKGLKALGDRSKFDILCSLKIRPKYNLEIAEELGLTAATMSHHMGVLLSCRFVEVDKQDGKIYYHLNLDNIQEFIRALEKTFV